MKFTKHITPILVWTSILFLLMGCKDLFNTTYTAPPTTTEGGFVPIPTPTPTTAISPTITPTATPIATGPNVMQVTVNGALCGDPAYQYGNEPCTSVTLCEHGTSNCQTINNILLDTGSYGLRIFGSLITVPTTPIVSGSGTLAECVTYADNTSDWGQVAMVDVRLGNEPAVQVPIQVINSNYASPPSLCSSTNTNPDINPQNSGYNGILGIGLFQYDCGPNCQSDADYGQYFSCSGSTCTPTVVPLLSNQVQNPVALLPVDNNGVILQFPSVPDLGAVSLTGSLILGIGTAANNIPSGAKGYAADQFGDFSTVFSAYSSTPLTSFIDSGSSIFFIPPIASLPDCGSSQGGGISELAGYFCPSSTQTLTATNLSASGSPSGNVSFQVANAYTLFTTNNGTNYVFGNLGASSLLDSSTGFFDWGIPFFYGRSVYVGIEGTSTSLGTGPYWAY